MRKSFICGVSAAALVLGAAGAAQADHSLLNNLQGNTNNLLDHMEEFGTGNWTNFAVNTAEIDASVNVDGGIAVVTTDFEISGAETIDFNLLPPSVTVSGALAVDIDEELQGISVDAGDIETMAVGAVNTGDIASAPIESASGEFGVESVASAAESATSKTSASAAYASYEASGEFSSLSGPAGEVFAANFAYNNADIDASVNLGPLANADSISTLAAGAINTGTISMGFDGSAFNSAINGD